MPILLISHVFIYSYLLLYFLPSFFLPSYFLFPPPFPPISWCTQSGLYPKWLRNRSGWFPPPSSCDGLGPATAAPDGCEQGCQGFPVPFYYDFACFPTPWWWLKIVLFGTDLEQIQAFLCKFHNLSESNSHFRILTLDLRLFMCFVFGITFEQFSLLAGDNWQLWFGWMVGGKRCAEEKAEGTMAANFLI